MPQWVPVWEFDPDLLEINLRALKKNRPELFEQIQNIPDTDDVLLYRNDSGIVSCAMRRNSGYQELVSGDTAEDSLPRLEALQKNLSPPSQTGLIYMIGWDLGYAFTRLYQHHIKPSPWKLVVVIEPDPRLLAASLAIHNLEEIFETLRIFFILGDDWANRLERIAKEEHLFALSNIEVCSGCPDAANTGQRLRPQVRQVSERAMRLAQDCFEKELREAALYYSRRIPRDIRKILAVEMKGGMAVSYIHKRFLDECSAMGIDIHYHRPASLDGMRFVSAIARERPDCVVMMNLAPESHAPLVLLDRLRVPRFVWFLDDPHNFTETNVRFGQHDFLFSWDMSYRDFYQSHGAQSVDHFPYVADLDKAKAIVREEFRSPVSYIGQVSHFVPKDHGLDEKTGEMCKRAGQQKSLEPQRSYRSLVEEFQREFGLQILHSKEDPVPHNIGNGIYMIGNALLRIRILERLIPYGLRLYGNEDWLKVLDTNHPLRDCFRGPADPVRDVPDIFVSSLINLNIHSLHAVSSLNQRDFNCPLVGGFLLSDWVTGADGFFIPDREMIFYHNVDDLDQKIRFYLENPEARNEIIQKGKERVLAEHIYARRVPRVLKIFKNRIQDRYKQRPDGKEDFINPAR